ncbi:MAG TPA: GPW/gp25 family protein [Polyangiaceae bacterium]|nr:GPW/gp25 family protein [Polyangiaceae bacterium]
MFLHKHFGGGDGGGELDDVARNLAHVLGTRRGAGYFLKSFGLSDAGFRTPEESVTALTAELRETIRLYEPRVELVDIDEDYDDDGARARLVVALRLRSHGERLRLVVDLSSRSFDIVALAADGGPG